LIKPVNLSKRNGILKLKGRVKQEGDSLKQKPYPIPEEDSFISPDDFPEGLKYILNNTKSQLFGKTSFQ
jgi:hypothetical protein